MCSIPAVAGRNPGTSPNTNLNMFRTLAFMMAFRYGPINKPRKSFNVFLKSI